MLTAIAHSRPRSNSGYPPEDQLKYCAEIVLRHDNRESLDKDDRTVGRFSLARMTGSMITRSAQPRFVGEF